MTELVVNSRHALGEALQAVSDAWERSKYIRVVVRERKRSLSQNDQAYVWYRQIARELKEDTELGVKCECKLNIGVPLLVAADEDFRELWSRFDGWTHEQKLQVMKWLPVTSLMPVDVASHYLSEMQSYWSNRGVRLEFLQKGKMA